MQTETTGEKSTNGNVVPGGFKLRAAAKYLSISEISVRRLIARGLIKPNRSLRHVLISRAELDRFLAG